MSKVCTRPGRLPAAAKTVDCGESGEDQYRAIFNGVNDGILITNPVTGRFRDANRSCCEMFGYEMGELTGQPLDTLLSGIPPYTREAALELYISSLNYLRRFSVDRIKIAREFIADVAVSRDAAAIVKCILNLARDLGNGVVAEGVETAEQLKLLQEWGCPDIQGFYFAEPMAAEAVARLLSAGAICPTCPTRAN